MTFEEVLYDPGVCVIERAANIGKRGRGRRPHRVRVAKVLRRHTLGRAKQCVAVLASLTAIDIGQVTEQALEGPFGFCLYASYPGQVVDLHTFYIGTHQRHRSGPTTDGVDIATRTVCATGDCRDKHDLRRPSPRRVRLEPGLRRRLVQLLPAGGRRRELLRGDAQDRELIPPCGNWPAASCARITV